VRLNSKLLLEEVLNAIIALQAADFGNGQGPPPHTEAAGTMPHLESAFNTIRSTQS